MCSETQSIYGIPTTDCSLTIQNLHTHNRHKLEHVICSQGIYTGLVKRQPPPTTEDVLYHVNNTPCILTIHGDTYEIHIRDDTVPLDQWGFPMSSLHKSFVHCQRLLALFNCVTVCQLAVTQSPQANRQTYVCTMTCSTCSAFAALLLCRF